MTKSVMMQTAEKENVIKKHPNPCKFGFRCKFNKFKKCLFAHDAPDDEKLEALAKTFNNIHGKLETQMKMMQNELLEKNAKIQFLESKYEKK